MIKRLEIKNFENHEHSVFDNFSADFNLICGPSDCGKSSCIRAIKLVAFNEFDVKCVRTGAKFCEITLTTEKGSVYVKRSKTINEWKVTPINGETKPYASIGKAILDDVRDIIGLKIIKLGDITMKVNVMDQLEGHFMMAEIDGVDSSGSIRAQIIDEISGLAGIEGVIKEISSDHLRNKKENNVIEEKNQELKLKLHNEGEILEEEEKLKKANELLGKKADDSIRLLSIQETDVKIKNCDSSLSILMTEFSKYPNDKDLDISAERISEIDSKNLKLKELTKIKQIGSTINQSNKDLKAKIQNLKDMTGLSEKINQCNDDCFKLLELKKINKELTDVEELLTNGQNQYSLLPETVVSGEILKMVVLLTEKQNSLKLNLKNIQGINSLLKQQQSKLNDMPNLVELSDFATTSSERYLKLKSLIKINQELDTINKTLFSCEKDYNNLDEKFHNLKEQNDEILNQYTICPMCDRGMEKK